jgi:hypothetical protein
MTYEGVARVITETTRATIGVGVSPGFRTAIATSAAIHGGGKRILRARCCITLTTVSPKPITIAEVKSIFGEPCHPGSLGRLALPEVRTELHIDGYAGSDFSLLH